IARPPLYREPWARSVLVSAEIAVGRSTLMVFSPQPLCFRDGQSPLEPGQPRLSLLPRPTNSRLCLALQIRRGFQPTSSQLDSRPLLSSLCDDLASWTPFFAHGESAQAYRPRL